jgi:hypothetical protein
MTNKKKEENAEDKFSSQPKEKQKEKEAFSFDFEITDFDDKKTPINLSPYTICVKNLKLILVKLLLLFVDRQLML